MKQVAYGMIPSGEDSRDYIFESAITAVPEEYMCEKVPGIFDQGQDPICAAVSISTIVGWQNKIKDPEQKDNKPDFFKVYDLREDKGMEGMIPREALLGMKKVGASGQKIKGFYRVTSVTDAKKAIMTNGPLFIGTSAYASNSKTFWKPINNHDRYMGGHATVLVGWDKDGFVLQNSWGYQFASRGRTKMPFEDWAMIMEAWSILI